MVAAATAALLLAATAPVRAQEIGEPYVVEGAERPATPPESSDNAADDPQTGEGVEAGPGEAAEEPVAGATNGRSPEFLRGLWRARRDALATGDTQTANRRLSELVDAKERAGWPDAFVYADAIAAEAEFARTQNDFGRARRLSEAAVRLAPHKPSAHMSLASARWALGEIFGSIGAWFTGMMLTFSEAPLFRTRMGNALLALLFATIIATGVFSLMVIYRYATLMVHDVRHILPKGATSVQMWLIGVTALLAPLLFRLGPVVVVAVWITLLGLYYTNRERIAAAAAVAVLAATPIILPQLTVHLSYPGSRAQDVYLATRSIDAEGSAARLEERTDHRPEELYTLGLRAHWSGRPAEAQAWLDKALQLDGESAQLHATLGNVRFALNDTDGAIAAYRKAIERDPDHVVAHFNLSRVFYALAEHQKAGVAHRDATAIDYERVELYAQEAKRAGPGFVVPVDAPRHLLSTSVEPDASHGMAVEQIWRWLGARMPRLYFAALGGGLFFLLIGMGLLRKVFNPAMRCQRCGMAACSRCNPELPDKDQCGQCYHAFVKTEGVEQQLRIRKEIEAHRYKARATRVRWFVSILLPGAGQIQRGVAIKGLLLMIVFGWSIVTALGSSGIIPEPTPVQGGTQWLGLVLATLIAVGTYIFALLDGVREER